MKISTFSIAVVSAVMITISACGGGGGGGSFSPTTNEVIIGDGGRVDDSTRTGGGGGDGGEGNRRGQAVVAVISGEAPGGELQNIVVEDTDSIAPVTPVISPGFDVLQQPNGNIGIRVDIGQPAPEGGVAVRLNLVLNVDADNFEIVGGRGEADCNGLVCTITIPRGERDIHVVLRPIPNEDNEESPIDDDETDDTLSDDDETDNDPVANPDTPIPPTDDDETDNDPVANPDTPIPPTDDDETDNDPVANPDTPGALDFPTPSPSLPGEHASMEDDATREGVSGFIRGLEYASIGLWVKDNSLVIAPAPGDTNGQYPYYGIFPAAAFVTVALPGRGTATYDVEGDAIYRGIRFFPDGAITMDFEQLSWEGHISASGGDVNRPDDFGSATAMVPDGNGGMRAVDSNDFISFSVGVNPGAKSGGIYPFYYYGNHHNFSTFYDFSGNNIVVYPPDVEGRGFFADLDRAGTRSSNYYLFGTFSDAPDYDPATHGAPSELSGFFGTSFPILNDNIKGGFLGKQREDN